MKFRKVLAFVLSFALLASSFAALGIVTVSAEAAFTRENMTATNIFTEANGVVNLINSKDNMGCSNGTITGSDGREKAFNGLVPGVNTTTNDWANWENRTADTVAYWWYDFGESKTIGKLELGGISGSSSFSTFKLPGFSFYVTDDKDTVVGGGGTPVATVDDATAGSACGHVITLTTPATGRYLVLATKPYTSNGGIYYWYSEIGAAVPDVESETLTADNYEGKLITPANNILKNAKMNIIAGGSYAFGSVNDSTSLFDGQYDGLTHAYQSTGIYWKNGLAVDTDVFVEFDMGHAFAFDSFIFDGANGLAFSNPKVYVTNDPYSTVNANLGNYTPVWSKTGNVSAELIKFNKPAQGRYLILKANTQNVAGGFYYFFSELAATGKDLDPYAKYLTGDVAYEQMTDVEDIPAAKQLNLGMLPTSWNEKRVPNVQTGTNRAALTDGKYLGLNQLSDFQYAAATAEFYVATPWYEEGVSPADTKYIKANKWGPLTTIDSQRACLYGTNPDGAGSDGGLIYFDLGSSQFIDTITVGSALEVANARDVTNGSKKTLAEAQAAFTYSLDDRLIFQCKVYAADKVDDLFKEDTQLFTYNFADDKKLATNMRFDLDEEIKARYVAFDLRSTGLSESLLRMGELGIYGAGTVKSEALTKDNKIAVEDNILTNATLACTKPASFGSLTKVVDGIYMGIDEDAKGDASNYFDHRGDSAPADEWFSASFKSAATFESLAFQGTHNNHGFDGATVYITDDSLDAVKANEAAYTPVYKTDAHISNGELLTFAEPVVGKNLYIKVKSYKLYNDVYGFMFGEIAATGMAELTAIRETITMDNLPTEKNLLAGKTPIDGITGKPSTIRSGSTLPPLTDGHFMGVDVGASYAIVNYQQKNVHASGIDAEPVPGEEGKWFFYESWGWSRINGAADYPTNLEYFGEVEYGTKDLLPVSFDLGKKFELTGFAIGSTCQPSSWAIGAAPTTVEAYEAKCKAFDKSYLIKNAEVYASNDMATLYDAENKVAAYADLSDTDAVASLLTLPLPVTARYVGFKLPAVSVNNGSVFVFPSELAAYGNYANALQEYVTGAEPTVLTAVPERESLNKGLTGIASQAISAGSAEKANDGLYPGFNEHVWIQTSETKVDDYYIANPYYEDGVSPANEAFFAGDKWGLKTTTASTLATYKTSSNENDGFVTVYYDLGGKFDIDSYAIGSSAELSIRESNVSGKSKEELQKWIDENGAIQTRLHKGEFFAANDEDTLFDDANKVSAWDYCANYTLNNSTAKTPLLAEYALDDTVRARYVGFKLYIGASWGWYTQARVGELAVFGEKPQNKVTDIDATNLQTAGTAVVNNILANAAITATVTTKKSTGLLVDGNVVGLNPELPYGDNTDLVWDPAGSATENWLTFDMGKSADFDAFELYGSSVSGYGANGFDVYVSNKDLDTLQTDGDAPAYSTTDNVSNGRRVEFAETLSGRYLYVRLGGKLNGGNNQYWISEIAAEGDFTPTPKKHIVFVGDSITEGVHFPQAGSWSTAEFVECYPKVATDLLNKDATDFEYTFYNAGISGSAVVGNTDIDSGDSATSWFNHSRKTDKFQKCDILCLMLGTNDGCDAASWVKRAPLFLEYYKKIVDEYKKLNPDVLVFVSSTPYAVRDPYNTLYTKNIVPLERVFAEGLDAYYIPMFEETKKFIEENGEAAFIDAVDMEKGLRVHPGEPGHAFMGQVVADAIKNPTKYDPKHNYTLTKVTKEDDIPDPETNLLKGTEALAVGTATPGHAEGSIDCLFDGKINPINTSVNDGMEKCAIKCGPDIMTDANGNQLTRSDNSAKFAFDLGDCYEVSSFLYGGSGSDSESFTSGQYDNRDAVYMQFYVADDLDTLFDAANLIATFDNRVMHVQNFILTPDEPAIGQYVGFMTPGGAYGQLRVDEIGVYGEKALPVGPVAMEVDEVLSYVKDHKVDTTFTGAFDGYYFTNGIFDATFTGAVDGKYYAEGLFDDTFTGVYEDKYYTAGEFDETFTGDIEGKYFNAGEFDSTFSGDYNGKYYEDGEFDATFRGDCDGKYYTEGLFDETFTGVYEDRYYVNGLFASDFTGDIEGKYYENGEFDDTFVGDYNGKFYMAGVFMSSFTGDYSGKYYVDGVFADTFTGVYNSKYYKDGEFDETFTGDFEGEYFVNGEYAADFTGVADGKYYVEGEFAQTFTGLADGKYIVEGIFNAEYNDFYKDTDGTWYYLVDGAIAPDFNGFAKHVKSNTWFYVTDGKINWTLEGAFKHPSGVWFKVKGGQIDWNFNDFYKVSGTWFYFTNGQIDWNLKGLYKLAAANAWFYVQNGQIDWSYTGFVKHAASGTWFYVVNGQIDFGYNGFAKHAESNTWFYVTNGQINWTLEGAFKHPSGAWFVVKGGQIDWSYTGLYKAGGVWFYFANGQLDWNYTGTCVYQGVKFNVRKGQVVF